MKIKINHDYQTLKDVLENMECKEEQGDKITCEEFKEVFGKFAKYLGIFDLSFFVPYLAVKNDKEYTKMSEITEDILNDIGLEKFVAFQKEIEGAIEKAAEQAEKELENEEPTEEETENDPAS